MGFDVAVTFAKKPRTHMLATKIKAMVEHTLALLYPGKEINPQQINISATNAEYQGDYSVVLFPLLKVLGTSPQLLGDALGSALVKDNDLVAQYTVVGGYLNLSLKDEVWLEVLSAPGVYSYAPTGKNVMIEYSSPNTNKPLHFGHLRTNFLGFSMARIMEAMGHRVIKANLINDRGIHICKSMLAWQRAGNGETPESSGLKGDHLVGKYYVLFNQMLQAEVKDMVAQGIAEEKAERTAPIMKAAQTMLQQWEAGDAEVVQLWKTMNSWVYSGFDKTYQSLGIDFDKYYYESDTYLLGKNIVVQGLEKGVLYKKEDGSVWIDLSSDGLDQKLLLRADGTSVYMTQDLGTALLKQNEYNLHSSVYVIGDEQNYHMQVLKIILKKLGEPAANTIHHLSYGMVDLPTGKMKSRDGTVVDADDMIVQMIAMAKAETEAAGKTEGFTEAELEALYKTIGLGAVKFYLLRIDPKKRMLFNPKESIDLHGFTAAFIQYAHARIASILRKTGIGNFQDMDREEALLPLEKKLVLQCENYPAIISQAAQQYNPSLIANYAFSLAQLFNTFYAEHSIANAETPGKKTLRLLIAARVKETLLQSMYLLGIDVPERM